MKANVARKPILSISMIVKNEGKTLRRCLDSVKKIMDQIDCQLIITDTGSTDDTVEIAKEYAHIVNSFEWCDDYSAARNFGIELANGEWYAFIDADEWYSDELVCSIVEFFKSKKYNSYNNCTLLMRNYHDVAFTDFADFSIARYFKLMPDTRFRNKIHENLMPLQPTFILKGICYHDGYVFSSNAEAFAKKYDKYNIAIEKQLAEDDNNLGLLVSYMASVKDPAREEEIILKALSLIKPTYPLIFCNTVYYRAILYYFHCQKYNIAIKYIDEYKQVMAKHKYEIYLDGYQVMALVYAYAKMYPEAIKYTDIYLKGYEDYLTSPPKFNSITVNTISKLSKETFLLDIVNKIGAYDLELALKYYHGYSLEDGKFYSEFFDVMLINYTASPVQAALHALLDSVASVKSSERRELLQQKIAVYLLEHIDDTALFAQLNDYPQNIFTTSFCRLNLAMSNTNAAPVTANVNIAKLCENECIAPYLAELLCHQLDASSVLFQLSREQIYHGAQMLTTLGSKLCQLCLDNITHAQNATELKPLMFYISILDTSLKSLADSQEESKQLITTTVIACMARFARGYYRQELINSNIELLPSAHRFALIADNANNALNQGEYISFLRNAITSSPDMKPLAQTLLTIFEQKLRSGELKPKTEFELLAENVKQNAKAFIAQGRLQDATAVLTQLKGLLPQDLEIDNLLLMCK